MGEITQTLVHGVFILNMNNKNVQEKLLCVEPYDNPQDALQNAISYETEVNGRRSGQKLEIGSKEQAGIRCGQSKK